MSGTVGDQTAAQDPEVVTYLFDASTNRVTRNGNPVLMNVSSFQSTYYDASGNSATSVPGSTISSLNKIKKIHVQWTLTAENGGDLKEEVVVVLRNYK